MNRIAFYLFKFKGESATFLNFTMRLKILQTSNYQKRLAFWLNIIDDNGTEMIAREDIEKVLKLSYIQDISFRLKITDITDIMYSKDNSELSINKILEIANKDQNVKELMQSLLQFDPKEVIDA